MSKLNIVLQNNSGRKLIAVAMWHNGTKPSLPTDYLPENAFIAKSNVAAGEKITVNNLDVWPTPLDYWMLGVKFEGDGETYTMCGDIGSPFKEYRVSSDHLVTFVLNEYSEGTAEQNDIDIYYDNHEYHQTAYLWNHTTVIIAGIAQTIVAGLIKIASEA